MTSFILSAFATACGLASILGAATPARAEQVAFRDDFNSLDTERWYISDGWSNGEWQACTWSEEMLAVQEGVLAMTISPASQNESGEFCAEIQSRELYLYGTFEARLRTDLASGANAAFFTYIGPSQGAVHNEIDVEILTRNTREVQFATHIHERPSYSSVVSLPNGGTADAEFHTYSFIWEPERVRWYVDGVLAEELTGADVPQVAQKIFLSHWNSRTLTDWMGEFIDPGRPLEMSVDWVAYTPPGAGCRFEGSVLCVEGVDG